MFVLTSSTAVQGRHPSTPPDMTALKLPGIKELDLPLAIAHFALPSPPLTPTPPAFHLGRGRWSSGISSGEEIHSEALTKLSRDALYYLNPVEDHEAQKRSASKIGEPLILSARPQLPPISAFMREVRYMETGPSVLRNPRTSQLPTPLPSPISSSNAIFALPHTDERVPWSRARFPTADRAADFLNQKATKDYEMRKREGRGSGTQNIRQSLVLHSQTRHRNDARVKKPKAVVAVRRPEPNLFKVKFQSDEVQQTRHTKEYTLVQECFIIYHKAELKYTWKQLEDAYNSVNLGQPHRSESALSCCYYRTNANIPLTTPDGLLVLRWKYGEEEETRIKEEMVKEQRRLEEEWHREMIRLDEEERLQEEEERRREHRPEVAASRSGSASSNEKGEKIEGPTGCKDKKKRKKKKRPKKPCAPYPFSVHGGGGIPMVEYKTAPVLVRDGGDVYLFQRFPEVLADERNTWVLPEDRELAKEIAARRMQQRLEWRAWMQENHPDELVALETRKKTYPFTSATA